jgi:hypothetical protein
MESSPAYLCTIVFPPVCRSCCARLTNAVVSADSIDKEKSDPYKHCASHQHSECRKAEIETNKWTGKLNAIVIKQLQQLLINIDKKGVIHLREAATKLSSAQALGKSSVRKNTARTSVIRYIDDITYRIKDVRPAEQRASAIEHLQHHLAAIAERERRRKAELERQETAAREQPSCGHAHEEVDITVSPVPCFFLHFPHRRHRD